MKIEKVNDHQIRCTLTKADLADRELKISELAYGTEKAKSLFRDMMQQASLKFGFEAEDIPLMIEAIPLNADCIVLIITKVEDPEELDTRFSKFAPSVHDSENRLEDVIQNLSEGADNVLDLFKKLQENNFVSSSETEQSGEEQDEKESDDLTSEEVETESIDLTKVFSFATLTELTRLANVLNHYYDGSNTLYKNDQSSRYLLVISKSKHTPEEFNKICNIVSEYGKSEKSATASESFLEEHYDLITKGNALQALSFHK